MLRGKQKSRRGWNDRRSEGVYEVTDSGPFEGFLRLPLALFSAEPVKLVAP
jgi:hypothetical protein